MLKPIKTTLLSITLVTAPAYAAQPTGFERWIAPWSSNIFANMECADIQANFTDGSSVAAALSPQGNAIPAAYQQNNSKAPMHRLIDIEVHRESGPIAHNVISFVTVENAATFELKSWLLCDLSATDIHAWAEFGGGIIVDIEHYTSVKDGTTRYAAILQENPNKARWQFLQGTSIDGIKQTAKNSGMRALDIEGTPGAIGDTWDAIIVENSGANQVAGDIGATSARLLLEDAVPQGAQIVDIEIFASNPSEKRWAFIYVYSGNTDLLRENLSLAEVIDWHFNYDQRVVDLDYFRQGDDGVYFNTVHITD